MQLKGLNDAESRLCNRSPAAVAASAIETVYGGFPKEASAKENRRIEFYGLLELGGCWLLALACSSRRS